MSASILLSVIANVERDPGPNDDYTVAWYRGMISAAQHDEAVDVALLRKATKAVDAFRAERGIFRIAPDATAVSV